MAQPKPPKEQRFKEAPAFQFYHYSSIEEAEQRSGNIGFPIFSCQWIDDGTVLLGGGGGSKGRDVRSAVVSCRLVNGVAVDSFLPQQALIDPLSLSSATATLPSLPMLQAVGEVTTADDIVSALHWSTSTTHNTSIISAGAGSTSILFDLQGFGSLASSSLPACRDLNQTSGENLEYFRQVQQNTLSTNPEAAASFTRPTLPFSTPFKSPLLSNCLPIPQQFNNSMTKSTPNNGSNLANIISQLTRDGKRTLNAKIRFRSDFSTGDSFVSCVKLSACGNVFYSGGQDGVVRAWWVTDPELMATYVTRGVKKVSNESTNISDNSNSNQAGGFSFSNHNPSSASSSHQKGVTTLVGITETPQKHSLSLTEHSSASSTPSSPVQVGYVSPMFIPVAYRSQGIKDFDISADGTVMTVVDDKGGLSIWSLPTFEDIRQHGTRIPVDYVNEKGEIIEYPFESKRVGTVKKRAVGKNHIDDDTIHDTIHETEYDMSQSRSAAFYGVEDIFPIVDVTKNTGINHIKSLFWSPPVVDQIFPQSNNNPASRFGKHGLFDGRRDNNGDGDSDDDEEVMAPPNFPQVISDLNKHPSRNISNYILLSLVTQGRDSTWLCKHILEIAPKANNQQQPPQFNPFITSHYPAAMRMRLSTQLHVFNDASGTQMTISPNKHFIAVSGNDLHIYTSLDLPYVRTMHLLALNQSTSFNLSKLPPLALVASKQRCFSLPCTGLTFDPSSRLLLASSASRAITFLPVKTSKQETMWDTSVYNFSRFCCPVYYACCFHLCCKPHRRKAVDQSAPPKKQTKCQQKCNNVLSWIIFLLFFGWLFALCSLIKNKLCCRKGNMQRDLLNKAILAQNQRDDSVLGSSSLTIVNAVLLLLVVLFISQFVSEFGQQ